MVDQGRPDLCEPLSRPWGEVGIGAFGDMADRVDGGSVQGADGALQRLLQLLVAWQRLDLLANALPGHA